MSFKSGVVHGVFFVRWLDVEPGDCKLVLRQVQEARQGYRAPLVYVATVPADAPPPSDAIRKELTGAIPALLEYCATVHLVIEGGGMRRATIRSVAAGMFLFTGKRGKVMPHETALEALQKAGDLRVSPEAILATAKARNLVT